MPTTRTLRLSVPLIAGGALVVALVAVTTARQAPPSTAPASPAPVASALPAGLPAGEIQSVVERNGGKVIVVRPAQPAPVADSPAADGMKAYVDPASRRLSEGSAEEHAALNAKIATQQRALRQRALVSEQAVVGDQGEQGGYYAQVPDSAMVYTVAHQAGDTVVVDHEQGGENAVKNMKAGSRKAAGKEHRDDR